MEKQITIEFSESIRICESIRTAIEENGKDIQFSEEIGLNVNANHLKKLNDQLIVSHDKLAGAYDMPTYGQKLQARKEMQEKLAANPPLKQS